MKNAKIILLVLIGALLIGSMGCGGGSGGLDSEGNSEPQNEQQEQEQTDERVSQFVAKILTPGSDGAPIIFDYAPKPESSDENAAVDLQEVQFVKYISSKDLNSDGEYVKTIRLNQDSEYVIKYSHGGRSLNNASLNMRISAPDKNEMILDLTSNGAPENSSNDYYVPTELEVIPDENPCIIMYRFKAPLTGDYDFAVSELTLVSGDGLVKNVSLDVPFEFRIYGSEESYSAAEDEKIELSSRQILDIQRMVLASATEFNENGLPVLNGEEEIIDELQKLLLPSAEEADNDEEINASGWIRPLGIIPAAVIDDVPYDRMFEEGAGFYIHSGLRGVTDVVDDEAFSPNAIRNFTMPTPKNGNANNMKENFNVTVIATEEEHDRAMELATMTNFILLRDALGYNDRQDYARLGTNHTKIISVRYELIEDKPRTPDPKIFKLYDEAMEELKEKGYEYFSSEYGDYFVAGYTWGNRYDATIEMTFADERLCSNVQKFLDGVVKNAISLRDTGKSITIPYTYQDFQNDLAKYPAATTVRISHSRHTGRSSDLSFSLLDFANNLANFVQSSKKTPRSQYERLYVTLRRYREIEEARDYIPEALSMRTSANFMYIRNMTETIYRTRCYYNALMALPASHLMNGTALQEQWKNEFETELITKMKGNVNYICADENRISQQEKKFLALYNKYKALAERYNFYRYFVDVQKDTTSPSWSDSDASVNRTFARGFNYYDKSKIVQEDMKAGRYDTKPRYVEEANEGNRKADLSGSFSDEYIHWYETGYHDTNSSTGHDVNGQTIGKKSYHWHYTGGRSRRLEVFFHYRTIKMPDSLYPFAGLQ